ncbi:MAG: hypothetical protein NXI22_14790 [bacterium]|nr:hypothetical protein [bacterium]
MAIYWERQSRSASSELDDVDRQLQRESRRALGLPWWSFPRLPLGDLPESLLPDAWFTTHSQHRWLIADRRADERELKGDL